MDSARFGYINSLEGTMSADLQFLEEWIPERMDPGTVFVLENQGKLGHADNPFVAVMSCPRCGTMGLITRSVPDAELLKQAEALATELAQGPTKAYAGVKRLLYATANTSLDEQMELESEFIADAGRTHDGQEGIASFLAKRAPKFTGE